MWILLPLVFIGGFSSGRDVDLARRPMTLIALLLTLFMGVVMYLSLPSGCPGGTCIGDGIFLMVLIAVGAGVLGYLAGGMVCSLAESGALTEETQASLRRVLRWVCGAVIAGLLAAILFNGLGAADRLGH